RFGEVPGAAGIGGLLVDSTTPGLSVPNVRWMMGLRGMPEGDVIFRDCRVPADAVLCAPGDGFKRLMTSYNAPRVVAATVALGIAAAIAAYFINGAILETTAIERITLARYLAPIVEEVAKALIVVG
ncbi:hypothetical protein QMK83_29590, partial [Klebsiella pneumoniae]